MKNKNGYGSLLADSRFEAFLWTQFLGAFNDNVYKMIVSIMAVRVAGAATGSRYLAIAGAVFVIPFLLFAGYAGQLADRYSKTRVLQVTKAFEPVAMVMGIVALMSGRIDLLLVVLFLLATQANFFSPAKYGILPEMVTEADLSRANGLLELTTFVAIVIGTSFGTFLYERWQGQPATMGLVLLAMMTSWKRGRDLLLERWQQDSLPLYGFLDRLPQSKSIVRVPGQAIFLTGSTDYVPSALLHNLKHNKSLHERVVFVTIQTTDRPEALPRERASIEQLALGIQRVVLRYGFMESPNIPKALEEIGPAIQFDPMQASYFLGRDVLVPGMTSAMSWWRRPLFLWLANHAVPATEFFRIPSDRVVELGARVTI